MRYKYFCVEHGLKVGDRRSLSSIFLCKTLVNVSECPNRLLNSRENGCRLLQSLSALVYLVLPVLGTAYFSPDLSCFPVS